MTCPSFSDRDHALRQMMGPPTAQQHLQSSMGYPRWDLLPVEPVKAPSRTPLWLWLVAIPLVGVALISIARGVM
jgi:hypothetical protein